MYRASRCPHVLPRSKMPPPVKAVLLDAVPLPHRVDVFLGVLEGSLVQGSFLLLHRPAEIDDPLVGGAAGDRHAVHPRREHVRVELTVGIRGPSKPLPGEVARNVERTALGVAHECHACVPGEAPRLRQIDAGPAAPRRKIGVDVVHRLAVEPTLRREFVVRLRETHQRDAHGRLIDHPRLVAPGVEDRPAVGCPFQRTAVRPTPDGVGRD